MGQASERGAGKHITAVGASHSATAEIQRLLILVWCGMLVAAPTVLAGDLHRGKPGTASPSPRPTVGGNLAGPVHRQLRGAFRIAQERVRDVPTCSALFRRLGADGTELLKSIRFEGATVRTFAYSCGRGPVAAFTKVGGRRIRLLPPFASLSLTDATVTVLHEALHCAGLSEKPADPNGLTPQEINLMVKVNCDL
jgi:hypothetical protein